MENKSKNKLIFDKDIIQPLPNEELILYLLETGMEMKYNVFLKSGMMERNFYRRGNKAVEAILSMIAKSALELAEVTVTQYRITQIMDLLGNFSKEEAEMGLDEQNDEVFKLLINYYDADKNKQKGR